MNIIISLLFYIIGGIGVSLTIKANIGLSPFDSFCLSLAEATGIKVGTVNLCANLIFLLIFILLSKGKYLKKYLLMIVSILSFGTVINIFTYTVFGNLVFHNYMLKVTVFILGVVISAFAVSIVLYLDIIPFSIESMCLELTKVTKVAFSKYRYGFDFLSIALSVIITYTFNVPLNVREGTVIAFLLFSGIISFTLKYCNTHLNKKNNN